MTSYCQYTPDKKEQSTQNQTKICAIIVFYVYFVLYIELLFGDVGLNGSLNNVATKNDISALNPTSEIKLYTKLHIGSLGAGWYRIAEAVFMTDTGSKGAASTFIEIMLRQTWNVQVGCFHKVKIILVHSDKAKISSLGIGTLNLTKVRVVRKSSILYFDVFSRGYDNETQTLLNIPFPAYITSAKAYSDAKIVPETADGEVVVCSVDLADSI